MCVTISRSFVAAVCHVGSTVGINIQSEKKLIIDRLACGILHENYYLRSSNYHNGVEKVLKMATSVDVSSTVQVGRHAVCGSAGRQWMELD